MHKIALSPNSLVGVPALESGFPYALAIADDPYRSRQCDNIGALCDTAAEWARIALDATRQFDEGYNLASSASARS
jgi:hypothetical protein